MKKVIPSNKDLTQKQIIINSQYILGEKIGEGAFSRVYTGKDLKTNKAVAIKTEKIATKNQVVLYEGKVLKAIQSKGSTEGIPQIYWYGKQDGFNFMAFELLGSNLELLWKKCGKKFTVKTVLLLADQMLKRLELLHERGYIHGDIKLSNFTVGSFQKSQIIHLIDYGLCKQYQDPTTGVHKPYKENQTLKGNTVFASINAHLGINQTRRDDLESLGYLLIYLYNGKFEWEGQKFVTKAERYTRIMDTKMTTPVEILCKGMPDEFMNYLTYCRELKYSEKPDYSYLRSLFLKVRKNLRLSNENKYDWDYLSSKERANTCDMQTTNSFLVSNTLNNTTGVSDDSSLLVRYSALRTKTDLGRLTYAITDHEEFKKLDENDGYDSFDDVDLDSSRLEDENKEIRSFPSKLMPNIVSSSRSNHKDDPKDLKFMTSDGFVNLESANINKNSSLIKLYQDKFYGNKEDLISLEERRLENSDNSNFFVVPSFITKESGEMKRIWVSLAENMLSDDKSSEKNENYLKGFITGKMSNCIF